MNKTIASKLSLFVSVIAVLIALFMLLSVYSNGMSALGGVGYEYIQPEDKVHKVTVLTLIYSGVLLLFAALGFYNTKLKSIKFLIALVAACISALIWISYVDSQTRMIPKDDNAIKEYQPSNIEKRWLKGPV